MAGASAVEDGVSTPYVPAIHVLASTTRKDVDARHKAGHDRLLHVTADTHSALRSSRRRPGSRNVSARIVLVALGPGLRRDERVRGGLPRAN